MEWFCRAGKPNHIFGYGQGSVKVEFCGKTYETQSKGEKWIVELLPQSYCDDLEIVVMLNFEKRTIKNVSIGEVFFVAGQSNVQMRVGEEICADEEYPIDEKLRIFAVDRPEQAPEVFKECDGWQSANKNNIKHFSAVEYHVGAELRKRFLCTRGENIRGNAENIDFELAR